jgi:hypothetical protein
VIELKVKLSEQDYYRLSLALAYKRRLVVIFSVLGIFNILAGILLEYYDKGVSTLIFGLVMSFLIPISLYFSSKRIYRANDFLQEELSYQISEIGIRVRGASYDTLYEWNDIQKIHMSKNWVLIYSESTLLHYIPTASFKSENDLLQLSRWAVTGGVEVK